MGGDRYGQGSRQCGSSQCLCGLRRKPAAGVPSGKTGDGGTVGVWLLGNRSPTPVCSGPRYWRARGYQDTATMSACHQHQAQRMNLGG